MHPEIVSDKPGSCPKCHMELVNKESVRSHIPSSSITAPKTPWTDWLPLITVLGYIVGLSMLTARLTDVTMTNLLTYSMGYFFVFFSLFKLINLSGFAKGYHEYDIISKRWYGWGYIYPFIELALGVFYLLRFDSPLLHLFTLVMSAVVCMGVGIKLAKKEIFQCACLGTVLKVPLTKVSLIEYATMAIMAVVMIVN